MARHFGVTAPTVSSDWRQHGRIDKKHYPKLVGYFELPYEWWFGSPDPAISSGAAPAHRRADATDPVVTEITKLWEYVPPEAQKAILAFMRKAKESSRQEIKDRGRRMPLGPAERSRNSKGKRDVVEKAGEHRG